VFNTWHFDLSLFVDFLFAGSGPVVAGHFSVFPQKFVGFFFIIIIFSVKWFRMLDLGFIEYTRES
jgi:hypothetical protein